MVGKPGKDVRAGSRNDHPSAKRKGRAGLVIVVVLLLLVIGIFVARNIEHAQELEENPSPPLPTAGQNNG